MKRILIYVFLALQVAGLTGFYAWHANIPDARYLLRTRPVDPRDLLRGDYMVLAYEISQPPGGMHEPENGEGATTFVRLKPDGRFWVADTIADAPQDDGAPWLRGRWKNQMIEYDIDQYFVPEGKGNPLGKITVEIAIRENGSPQIVQLYSDGQPWP
jgi:uncharacterized membrane-anchored protein